MLLSVNKVELSYNVAQMKRRTLCVLSVSVLRYRYVSVEVYVKHAFV